jgi:ATP-dependent Clp protease ATP-binding subunit ClpB
MLTEAVRRRPYQVVLFDEVEKAHPDVFNVLLQVLDDGRLTDGHGRTVDFKNVLLIMTSNLGAEILANQNAGEDSDVVWDGVMEVVKASFRPEFFNRIDEVLLFHRLSRPHMDGIVDIQLQHLRGMLEGRKITLDIDAAAKNWMADKGYDPIYGARPLRRVIQQELQNALATMVLGGLIADGDTVHVSAGEGKLMINGEVAGTVSLPA